MKPALEIVMNVIRTVCVCHVLRKMTKEALVISLADASLSRGTIKAIFQLLRSVQMVLYYVLLQLSAASA